MIKSLHFPFLFIHTYRQTYRETRLKLYTTPPRGWSNIAVVLGLTQANSAFHPYWVDKLSS